MSSVYVAHPSGEKREFDEEKIRELWNLGQVREGSLVWTPGMPKWAPLEDYLNAKPVPAEPSAEEVPFELRYTFTKDPARITAFLVFVLCAYLGIEVLSFIANCWRFALIGAERYSLTEYDAEAMFQAVIVLCRLLVFIVTVVAFSKWVYRANLNSRGFGATDMKFTPGWSVGYYFIPFLNMVRPYQSMKEIWKVSLAPSDWQSKSVTSTIRAWWGLWLVCGFLGWRENRAHMAAETVDAVAAATGFSVLNNFLTICLCLVTISMILEIIANQRKLVEGNWIPVEP